VLSSVAIVILNYNGKKHVAEFLPSVLATTYANATVYVADNGSTDDSVAFLLANFPQVKLITRTTNLGFAGGYNWALAQVQADYYVLLNSDVEVTKDWIEPIIEWMDRDTRIGACQPKILAYHQPRFFEYAGAAGGWIDALGYPLSRGRIFDVCEVDEGQYDSAENIFWATGAAMFVRAKVFHELEGFDADFFAHQEEIDLCWRMQLKGYTVMAIPQSVVYHVGAGTLPRGGRKVYLNFRNNLRMLCKNLPISQLWWKLPFRFLLDAISAWKGLFSGDIAFFTAIMRAHFSVIWWLLRGAKGVYGVPGNYMLLQGVYHGSVVWNYFIEQRKKFAEIILERQ
jgi:GT2 family glycosyltransferase